MIKPVNSVFLKIENIYQDEITFDSGVKILIPTYMDRERYCASTAIVHSVPDNLKLDIKAGDEVVIAYNIIADYSILGESVIYHRCHTIDNEVVWAADWLDQDNLEHMVMAKKVGEDWQPLGNWCMLEEIEEEQIFYDISMFLSYLYKKVGIKSLAHLGVDLTKMPKSIAEDMFLKYKNLDVLLDIITKL